MASPISEARTPSSSFPAQEGLSDRKTQSRCTPRDSLNNSQGEDEARSASWFSCIWTALRNFLACLCPCFFRKTAIEERSKSKQEQAPSSQTIEQAHQDEESLKSQNLRNAELFIKKYNEDGSFFKHYAKGELNPAMSEFQTHTEQVQIAILFRLAYFWSMKMKYIVSYIRVSKSYKEIEEAVKKVFGVTSVNQLTDLDHSELRKQVLWPLMPKVAPPLPSSSDSSPSDPAESSTSLSSSSVSTPTPNPAKNEGLVSQFIILFNSNGKIDERHKEIFKKSNDADKSKILCFLIQQKQEPETLVDIIESDGHFYIKAILKAKNTYNEDFLTILKEKLAENPGRLPECLIFTEGSDED